MKVVVDNTTFIREVLLSTCGDSKIANQQDSTVAYVAKRAPRYLKITIETACKDSITTESGEEAVFDHAIPYSAPVASFGEDWGFVLAFNGPDAEARRLVDLPFEVIDTMIEERVEPVPGVPEHRFHRDLTGNERGGDALKHYDGVVHRRLFSLSKPLRKAMKSDDRVMTEANPIFMY